MVSKYVRLKREDKENVIKAASLYLFAIRGVTEGTRERSCLEFYGNEEEIDLFINYIRQRGIDVLEGFYEDNSD